MARFVSMQSCPTCTSRIGLWAQFIAELRSARLFLKPHTTPGVCPHCGTQVSASVGRDDGSEYPLRVSADLTLICLELDSDYTFATLNRPALYLVSALTIILTIGLLAGILAIGWHVIN